MDYEVIRDSAVALFVALVALLFFSFVNKQAEMDLCARITRELTLADKGDAVATLRNVGTCK